MVVDSDFGNEERPLLEKESVCASVRILCEVPIGREKN